MKRKIKVAFDLDGVIADKPPFVPKGLLEWLFKGGRRGRFDYRFPHSRTEQAIRKLSHFYLFRPPIKKNIRLIKDLVKAGKYELFVVSGRYGFLKPETENWLKKRGLKGIFKKIYLNRLNEQPHLFKEKTLKQIRPDIFIDDDNEIVDYLTGKVGGKIYCFDKTNPEFSLRKAIL